MQPTLVQSPPTSAASTMIADLPIRPRPTAAVRPPDPDPMTMAWGALAFDIGQV